MLVADTIDYGAYVGRLRSFGPPEVVAAGNVLGNGFVIHKASLFWEKVEAVTFTIAAAAGGAVRQPRLQWFAGEAVPFAVVTAAFTLAATDTAVFSFALGVQQAGANNAAAIVTPLPPLWLLPNWTLKLDVIAGAAGDTVSNVRIARTRFELIPQADAGADVDDV